MYGILIETKDHPVAIQVEGYKTEQIKEAIAGYLKCDAKYIGKMSPDTIPFEHKPAIIAKGIYYISGANEDALNSAKSIQRVHGLGSEDRPIVFEVRHVFITDISNG